MRYIYADLNNGCIEIDKSNAEIEINSCDSMSAAEEVLNSMSEKKFEAVIAVDEPLFDAIKVAYGVAFL